MRPYGISNSRSLPFDRRAALGATLQDLDLDYVRTQYVPRAMALKVLEQNRRPLHQQLQALRLISADRPTYGAAIGFARDPQAWVPGAYVQFLRFHGPRMTDPIRFQRVLTGRLEDVLRRMDELLELNISVRTEVAAASREIRRPDYPLVALQQLVQNAVMHRAYEAAFAPVGVFWYSDRVEIHSPGGLYGQVTPENFGTTATDYRNPLVAEIMTYLGFARRLGLGMPLVRLALARNGNPQAEFRFEPALVAVTLTAAA